MMGIGGRFCRKYREVILHEWSDKGKFEGIDYDTCTDHDRYKDERIPLRVVFEKWGKEVTKARRELSRCIPGDWSD